MIMDDAFMTLSQAGSAEFKSKGSRFIAYATQVKSQEQIREYLEIYKKEHFKSRHICYAYRLGSDAKDYRANDDGEPSGSAGLPILNAMKSQQIVNGLVAVVRYFGGTKLGIPGLIEAYKTSAAQAITDAVPQQDFVYSQYKLSFEYDILGPLMEAISKTSSVIKSQSYEENPFISLMTKKSLLDSDLNKICTKLIGYEIISHEEFKLKGFKIDLLDDIEGLI